MAPQPPPRRTASGPLHLVVDSFVAWGNRVSLRQVMHPGLTASLSLTGDYQLPHASGQLWMARLFVLCVIVLSIILVRDLCQLEEHHRVADAAFRCRGGRQYVPPSQFVSSAYRTRILLAVLGVMCAAGFTSGFNSTVSDSATQAVRVCSMLGARCSAETSVMIGAYLGLVAALMGSLAAALAWFANVWLPVITSHEMGELPGYSLIKQTSR